MTAQRPPQIKLTSTGSLRNTFQTPKTCLVSVETDENFQTYLCRCAPTVCGRTSQITLCMGVYELAAAGAAWQNAAPKCVAHTPECQHTYTVVQAQRKSLNTTPPVTEEETLRNEPVFLVFMCLEANCVCVCVCWLLIKINNWLHLCVFQFIQWKAHYN